MRFWGMSRYNISENDQRELFVKRTEGTAKKLYYEVPVFCRSVDLVLFDFAHNTITAIEFKLTNWKRAAQQALSVAICFDYVEICIPQPKTEKGKKAVIDYCTECGIGIYFLDIETGKINHVVLPQKLHKIWEIQRTKVINYLGRQKK
jgi:hypothetical protein